MRVTCAVLLMGLAASVLAHKPSDSFLRISTTDGIAIQWDIALRDLEV